MDEQKWTDDKMEKLFKEMPDLKDSRSKEEILDKLKKDERIEPPIEPKRKKPWLPASVAVAALLVLSFLLPSMLNDDKREMDQTMEISVESGNVKEQFPAVEHSETYDAESAIEEEAMEVEMFSQKSDPGSHILLPGQLEKVRTLQVGFTHEAIVFPVTILIPDSRIAEDFTVGRPDSVALYNKYAKEFPELELGFDAYHPYKGELTVRDDIVYHRLPTGHPYDIASAAVYVYEESVRATFTDHKELRVVDENGGQAQFDQVGAVEPIKLTGGKKQLPYYKYVFPSGDTYLLPEGGIAYKTVEAALLCMKERPNDLVQPLVPETIEYDVREDEDYAVITFRKPLDLSEMETVAATEMIEGFMLTAQNYGKTVKLENVVQDQFGKYDLVSVLPEPVAVNPVNLDHR